MFSFPGSHTWTIPAGVTQVFAFVIGGGGGGEAYSEANSGGAGGGYAHGVISGLTPGNTITCTVGQGGMGHNNMSLGTQADGTASSFGSYLTGNGGGKGVYGMGSSASVSSTGGSASTSGVSEAFTATGGDGGLNDSGEQVPAGFGGGASGSPFGTPKSTTIHGSSHPYKPICVGGSGWYGSQNHVVVSQYGSRGINNIGSCGMGGWGTISHYTPPSDYYSYFNAEGPRGGNGRIGARGGRGAISNMDFWTFYGYMGNSTKASSQEARYYNNNARPAGMVEGGQAEDGTSLDWWFPWEMDGGGGGGFDGAPMTDQARRPFSFSAANGGNGSGGGACNCMSYRNDSSTDMSQYCDDKVYSGSAGHGGFGGGGGGTYNSSGATYFYHYGGHGGVGGGGGSCAWYQSSRYYRAGKGGDGIVAIYW